MAKFVIAGQDDCPYYAKAELLGDRLVKNLPDFKVHKIVKTKAEWEGWMKNTCSERGWEERKSPLVWRELLDRGGKGVLIGGANEFQEYVKGYYNINSDLTSDDMRKISAENSQMKAELDKEQAEFKAQSKPIHVCISNASKTIAYHLINSLASGETFGPSTEITLRLLDEDPANSKSLAGLKMEAEDLCYDLLRGVTVTSDPSQAFRDCSSILLIDNLHQKSDESRQDWLKRNVEHYTNYAKIINEVAKKNVKILIAGNGPVNLCATMMIKHAPNIPRQNIAAMSRMIENYAKSVIGGKLNLNTSNVLDLIVWGNINSKKYVDLSQCKVRNYDGAIWGPPSFTLPAVEMIHDNKWIEGEYIEIVQQRRSKVKTALDHSASVSFSSAIITMLQHWWNGTPKGQLFSLGVCSEGWYDVPEGLVFSFPITMHPKGYWNVVQDIEVPTDVKAILLEIVSELQNEIEELTAVHPPETCESEQQAGDSVLIQADNEVGDSVPADNEVGDSVPADNKGGDSEQADKELTDDAEKAVDTVDSTDIKNEESTENNKDSNIISNDNDVQKDENNVEKKVFGFEAEEEDATIN